MSSIPPHYRGYRQALRDVQHATEIHGNGLPYERSGRAAIHVAASMIGYELYHLNRACDAISPRERAAMQQFLADMQAVDRASVTAKAELFLHGYRAGFAKAIEFLERHARQMIDPYAERGIMEVVGRLGEVLAEVGMHEDGTIRTFRTQKAYPSRWRNQLM